MLNNNEIFDRSGKVFYMSMKQNIYLKTGLMKGVSLILRSKKVYFEGKIIYSISFYGNNI